MYQTFLKYYLSLGLINVNATIIGHSIAPVYFDNLEDVKKYANEIICFYSDNDPYVRYETEKDFADKIATEQVTANIHNIEIKYVINIVNKEKIKKL